MVPCKMEIMKAVDWVSSVGLCCLFKEFINALEGDDIHFLLIPFLVCSFTEVQAEPVIWFGLSFWCCLPAKIAKCNKWDWISTRAHKEGKTSFWSWNLSCDLHIPPPMLKLPFYRYYWWICITVMPRVPDWDMVPDAIWTPCERPSLPRTAYSLNRQDSQRLGGIQFIPTL